MNNDLTDNPTIIKSCADCEYKEMSGWCNRTGRWCSAEMVNGSMCNVDGELLLWVQRLGFFPRLYKMLFSG